MTRWEDEEKANYDADHLREEFRKRMYVTSPASEPPTLKQRILRVFEQAAERELSIRWIEVRLMVEHATVDELANCGYDTFDVRDTVHELVAEGLLATTPCYRLYRTGA